MVNFTILAFDVSNFVFSVAVKQGSEVPHLIHKEVSRGHDAELIPAIEQALALLGIDWSMLDCAITTTGPGSFTGVRVGLSVAQALSLTAPYPVFGINNFEFARLSYAHDYTKTPYLMVALQSGREDAYVQLYDEKGAFGDAFCLRPEDWQQVVSLDPTTIMCVGNGAKAFSSVEGLLVRERMPTALDLTIIAEDIMSHESIDNYHLVPFYLKSADVTIKKADQ